MNTLSALGTRLRRRVLLLVAVVALVAALAPTAAFAASAGETMNIESYGRGHQGRKFNRSFRHHDRQFDFKKHDFKRHDFKKHDFKKHDFKKHDFKKHDFKKHDSKKSDHKSCRASYSVKKGDTLTKIAKKHHSTVFTLAKKNGIKNANRITTGQRLCIH